MDNVPAITERAVLYIKLPIVMHIRSYTPGSQNGSVLVSSSHFPYQFGTLPQHMYQRLFPTSTHIAHVYQTYFQCIRAYRPSAHAFIKSRQWIRSTPASSGMMQCSNRKPHNTTHPPSQREPGPASLTSVLRSCLDRCGCPMPAAEAAPPTDPPPVARSSSIASAITKNSCQSRGGVTHTCTAHVDCGYRFKVQPPR